MPKPGDRLPLKGVDVQIVSSDTKTIAEAVDSGGQRNPDCRSTAPESGEAIENPRSTGIRLRFGRFTLIDLGDLSGQPLYSLFCPTNLLGKTDVYLPRWTPENRPLIDTSKPATTGVATETVGLLIGLVLCSDSVLYSLQ